jgi:KDO2-lipid IV(A) lauroyltransferase
VSKTNSQRTSPLDWLAVLLVRSMGLLPRRVALWLGGEVGRWFCVLAKRKRARAAFNFRRAGIVEPERAARRAFRNIGRSLFEMLWIYARPVEQSLRYLRVTNKELFDQIAETGRGALVVSGHIGNWELASLAGTQGEYPVAVIAREFRTPRLERIVHSFREGANVRTLLRGADGTAIAAMRWLARGNILCCMMDRASSGRRVSVPLIWGRMNIPLGPIELACRTKAAIVLASTRRREDSLTEVTFRILDTSGSDEPRAVAAVVGQALEDEIRERMDQWFWVYRREPEPEVYLDAEDELEAKRLETG